MPLPALRCPNDRAHAAFKGTLLVCDCHQVTLGHDWAESARGNTQELHQLSDVPDYPVTCAECGAQVWRPRRSISFVPAAGMMLLCDFSTGFRPPEMIKVRVVIVVSERDKNRDTCIVVPISTNENRDSDRPVVPLTQAKYGFLRADSWAKCQIPNAVALRRLYLLRGPDGRGLDSHGTMIDAADLRAVRNGAEIAIGLA